MLRKFVGTEEEEGIADWCISSLIAFEKAVAEY
jgi:hypothetical protein